MTMKEVLNSEECKDLRILLGITNTLIKRVTAIEEKSGTNDFAEVGAHLYAVQMKLCALHGKAMNDTLTMAREIEQEEGYDIHHLGRPTLGSDNDTAEAAQAEPQTEEQHTNER